MFDDNEKNDKDFSKYQFKSIDKDYDEGSVSSGSDKEEVDNLQMNIKFLEIKQRNSVPKNISGKANTSSNNSSSI